jgi:hypothetical protein
VCDLLGAVDVGESGVDEMRLSVLFHLEYRADESLDHGLVVHEAPVEPALARHAGLHVGLREGVARSVQSAHSNKLTIQSDGEHGTMMT